MESTLYVLVPATVYLPCDHGLDFDISLCDNSINQSINQSRVVIANVCSCDNSICRQLYCIMCLKYMLTIAKRSLKDTFVTIVSLNRVIACNIDRLC